jgi:hypothetical protein
MNGPGEIRRSPLRFKQVKQSMKYPLFSDVRYKYITSSENENVIPFIERVIES